MFPKEKGNCNMEKPSSKTRAFRFFWGLFPWLLVGLILAFIIVMGGRVMDEQGRLAEAKKAAI